MMKALYPNAPDMTDEQLSGALETIDSDGDGCVSFNEMIRWYISAELYTKYEPEKAQ
jgi:Ca2+-binding EF-hand superfamily protein